MLVPIWSRWHVIDHIFTDCTYLVRGFHLVLPCRVRVSSVNRHALANDTLDLFRGKVSYYKSSFSWTSKSSGPIFQQVCQPVTHLLLFCLLHTLDLCFGRLFWENFLIDFSSQEQSLYIISHHPHLHRDWLRRATALLWNSHSLEQ